MKNCDICGTSIGPEATRYMNARFKEMVRAGLRPPESPLSGLGLAVGLSKEQMDAKWVNGVMSDTTDWILCPSCAGRANKYLR